MKRAFLVFASFFFIIEFLSGQNSIGISEIQNFTKQIYGAGSQNWDIQQDENGIMYFANNEGLLTFDGSHWKTFPMPNRTIVRSIYFVHGKIYVGAQNEIGYFSPNKCGDLQYTSLVSLLPEKERSFADVWKIARSGNDIFFQTNTKILQLTENHFTIYHDADWKFIGSSTQGLLLQDYTNRLLQLRDHTLIDLLDKKNLPGDFLVTSFVPFGQDTSLLTTFKNGLWLLSGDRLGKFTSPDLELIASKNIYRAISLDQNQILLATSLGGCFVIDKQGNLVQRFSLAEGLQNNNVRQVFLDKNRNLWLALDNGIDFLAYDNAIKHIFTDRQNEGGGYAAIIHENNLYLGTSNGLYYTPVDQSANISLAKGPLKPVSKIKGQVWNLSEVYGQLLMGHHEGSFVIKNHTAIQIDKRFGFWNYFPFANASSPMMLAGTYQGISFYNYAKGTFVNDSNAATFESARIVAINGSDIWVAHPYKGIFKVNYSAKGPTYKSYVGKGLTSLSHYYIYSIHNKIVAPTEKGFYEYNAAKDEFEPSAFFEKIFGNIRVNYMKEDADGNIWFTSEKSLGVVEIKGGESRIIYIPELNGKMVSGFDFVYPVNRNNVLVGGEQGFYNINYEQYRKDFNKADVLIRKVKPLEEPNGLIFGGYYGDDARLAYTKTTVPELSYNLNSIQIEFSAVLYAQQANVEYSYKLDGFDKNWSAWSKKTEKEYTNLPPGTYTFFVKTRTNLAAESKPTAYSFTVLAPWYRSTWAYLIYLLFTAGGILYLYKRQKVKFVAQRVKYEEEQKRLHYLHQLEIDRSEKEIVKLKNDKLESEINHKNKELAAATMHLVQKGELMGKIREELVRSLKNMGNDDALKDLKKLLRMMAEDLKVDEDWSHFVFHFDRVHGDFLMLLKERFPNLTNNDLKVCAYLRMNLSTKEMAQLMNISVRGVELSRYRLRKKLQIPSDVNIFDYLVNSIKDEKGKDAIQKEAATISKTQTENV